MSKRVLFFDSGMGGLSILSKVIEKNPDLTVFYLYDNECFPYGTKSRSFLTNRIDYLLKRAQELFNLDLIVVACNTASITALPILRTDLNIPIVGVVPAIKPAAKITKKHVIGLVATKATVEQAYTKQLIKDFASDSEVLLLGSARLVAIAEYYMMNNKIDIQEIEEAFSSWLILPEEKRPDTVVLGCTHFPLIAPYIQKVLPFARLVDSGEAIGRRVATLLKDQVAENDDHSFKAFYTGHLSNPKAVEELFKKFQFNSVNIFPEKSNN